MHDTPLKQGISMSENQIEDYQAAIPPELNDLSHSRWIPWPWIRKSYTPASPIPLTALFEAYDIIASNVDLDQLASEAVLDESGECVRCGTCCTSLDPGIVEQARLDHWEESGAITGHFFREIARHSESERFYYGWFHEGLKLRLCPLLFMADESATYFCAVYHLGSGYRPEGCVDFRANPPGCGAINRS
jgi:hypothetical protein